MAKRRKSERTIILPWERRGGLVRRLGLVKARPFVVVALVTLSLAWLGARERATRGVWATRAELAVAARALELFRADHEGRCPRSISDLRGAGYLARVPEDAWGQPLRLVCPGRKHPGSYDLASDGPDGEPGGLDRIE